MRDERDGAGTGMTALRSLAILGACVVGLFLVLTTFTARAILHWSERGLDAIDGFIGGENG